MAKFPVKVKMKQKFELKKFDFKKILSFWDIGKIKEKAKEFAPRLLIAALVAVSITAFYFRQKSEALKKDPRIAERRETEELLSKIGALILLPEGEVPTIATVTDPDKLKNQSFFVKARKGDKVLIYANARKAILFSLLENKIIEVAPLNIGVPETPAPQSLPSSSLTPSASPSNSPLPSK